MSEEKAAAAEAKVSWIERVLGKVPITYQQDYIDWQIETNLTRTWMLSIFIIGVQVFLNVLNIVKPSSEGEGDIMKYVFMSLITLAIGVIYLILSIVMKRGHLKNRRLRRVLPFTLLYLYCAIQMVFLSFNVGTDVGMNSYIIALILVGFFVIMPPLLNLISIVVLFSVALTILVTLNGSVTFFNIFLLTDLWANLLIITFLVALMSYTTYTMYRNNFLNSKRLEVSNERLDLLAKTDSLTGLYNRWGFYENIDKQWTEYILHEKEAAVFMLDIDFFKEYNDHHGHLAGDKALKAVAAGIKSCFPPEIDGVVCRFGGEEFLCLAHVDSAEMAFEIAEASRKAVAENVAALEGGESLTISGGFATSTQGVSVELDSLIAQADDALYASKDGGRNRVHGAQG